MHSLVSILPLLIYLELCYWLCNKILNLHIFTQLSIIRIYRDTKSAPCLNYVPINFFLLVKVSIFPLYLSLRILTNWTNLEKCYKLCKKLQPCTYSSYTQEYYMYLWDTKNAKIPYFHLFLYCLKSVLGLLYLLQSNFSVWIYLW